MSTQFLVVGEALVDVVVPRGGPPQHAPGGSPLNVAVGLARLGNPAVLMTEVGDDEHGLLLARHAEDSGVVLHDSSVQTGHRTSTATAHLDETGAAAYTFELAWALGSHAVPDGTTAVHTGSLGAALRPGRDHVLDLVRSAAEADLLVSFDPNARPTLTPDAAQAWRDAREVAELATVVKMSEEDLEFLVPGALPEEVATELLGARTRLVVVTYGGDGALAVSREGRAEVTSRHTPVVDTVGAGDSFMAALLHVVAEHGVEQLTDHRLTAYVGAAHAAAAITVSRRGADPPRRDELPGGWPEVG